MQKHEKGCSTAGFLYGTSFWYVAKVAECDKKSWIYFFMLKNDQISEGKDEKENVSVGKTLFPLKRLNHQASSGPMITFSASVTFNVSTEEDTGRR